MLSKPERTWRKYSWGAIADDADEAMLRAVYLELVRLEKEARSLAENSSPGGGSAHAPSAN